MEPENEIKCPDCKEFLKESHFKQHIRNCPKFSGIALKQIKKLPRNLPILELKVTSCPLSSSSQNSMFAENQSNSKYSTAKKINLMPYQKATLLNNHQQSTSAHFLRILLFAKNALKSSMLPLTQVHSSMLKSAGIYFVSRASKSTSTMNS